MAMQDYSGPSSRNTSKAAGGVKPGEIAIGKATKAPTGTGAAPAKPGPGIQGFGGSHASTITGSQGKAPQAPGKAVQGFSGSGVKPGKIA